MAHNYNPQVQYPTYRTDGYPMQQLQQSSSSVYPDSHHPLDRTPAQYQYQQSTDVYQASRGQIGPSQLTRYPTTQTQTPQRSPERHSPLMAQPAGQMFRHPVQPDTRSTFQGVQHGGHQFQDRAVPVLRAATTAPQMQPSSNSARYTSTPPTSPTRSSQLRRPLPQRPGGIPSNSPGRRPLPDANSPPTQAPSLHRPSYSVDGSRTLPTPGTGSRSGASSDYSPNPSQSQSPRPLPEPIPRSTKSLDLSRSPSPMKQILETVAPVPNPGQKFVPLWKRSLPTPVQPAPLDGRGTSGNTTDNTSVYAPALQRSKTAGVRPLPPSPGQAHTYSTPQQSPNRSTFARAYSQDPSTSSTTTSPERSRRLPESRIPPQGPLPDRPPSPIGSSDMSKYTFPNRNSTAGSSLSSDSEDMYDNPLLRHPEQQRSPSPTYGIRSLPTRNNGPTGNTMAQGSERYTHNDNSQFAKTQSGGPRSMADRIAALTLTRPSQTQAEQTMSQPPHSPPKPSYNSSPMERTNSQGGTPRWPSDLPPLPRAPSRTPDPDRQKFQASANVSPFTNPSASFERAQLPGPPSPTRSQLPRLPQRDTSPTRPLPAAPAGRNPSPVRSFPSLRHPSPRRTQVAPPSPSAHYEPSSPTRAQPHNPTPPSEAPRGRSFPQTGSYARGTVPNLDDAPPPSLRRTPSPIRSSTHPYQGSQDYNLPNLPNIRTQDMGRGAPRSAQLTSPPAIVTPTSAASSNFSLSSFPAPPQASPVWSSSRQRSPERQKNPQITVFTEAHYTKGPSISVSVVESGDFSQDGIPQISFPGDDEDDTMHGPTIIVGNTNGKPNIPGFDSKLYHQLRPVVEVDDYPPCLGCGALIIGDAVNAMNGRWHPRCYRCCVCHESLEMLAPIEHDGKLYCNLDYHEKFSPRCYHCSTVIVDPTYITLEDKELGTRTYHDQHFFCSECGDPFVTPGIKNRVFEGDGPFEGGEVGAEFTVFHGFPYCSKCHAKLRWPKCKKCKKSMAPDSDIIEALGAKWCSDCFVCTGCHSPFQNGRLFLRDKKPFCQDCFEVMIKSEM